MNIILRRLLQVMLSAVALTVLIGLIPFFAGDDVIISTLKWNFLANFLIAIVLGFYITHSRYSSYRLFLATCAIFFIIGNFNIAIEAIIFNVLERSIMVKSMLVGIPYTFIGSFVLVWIFRGFSNEQILFPDFTRRKGASWILRILTANFLYIFFYIVAGVLIDNLTPGFSEFYEGKLPSLPVFFMTNMGFRGFVFVAIAILIDRSLSNSTLTKALLVGSVFSIIGGIAPLIPPSEYMPEFIRVAHGFEIGVSNFLYGITVLLIIRSKLKRTEALEVGGMMAA